MSNNAIGHEIFYKNNMLIYTLVEEVFTTIKSIPILMFCQKHSPLKYL